METCTTECRALKRAVKTGDLNKVAGETHRVNRLKTECALYGGSTVHASLLFAWSSILFSGLQVSTLTEFLPKSAAMPLSDELPHVRLFFSIVSPTFECLQTELEVIN